MSLDQQDHNDRAKVRDECRWTIDAAMELNVAMNTALAGQPSIEVPEELCDPIVDRETQHAMLLFHMNGLISKDLDTAIARALAALPAETEARTTPVSAGTTYANPE